MTKNEPKEIRLKQIIDAAVAEFLEKGYEGASMNSIAKRAGITKGGIYYHFEGKDEILLEANARYLDPIDTMMAKARGGESAVYGLKVFIREYMEYWNSHSTELMFYFLTQAKMLATPEMWPPMEEYLQRMVNFYEEMLAQGRRQGELKEHDHESRAFSLFSALNGVNSILVVSKSLSPEEAVEKIEKVFLEDIEIKRWVLKI